MATTPAITTAAAGTRRSATEGTGRTRVVRTMAGWATTERATTVVRAARARTRPPIPNRSSARRPANESTPASAAQPRTRRVEPPRAAEDGERATTPAARTPAATSTSQKPTSFVRAAPDRPSSSTPGTATAVKAAVAITGTASSSRSRDSRRHDTVATCRLMATPRTPRG
jgi:hypothetical protein